MSAKLICYLSLGYPSIKESMKMADVYVESGCGMIEVDIPTENAFLDGELISTRMRMAKENCSDYSKYFEAVKEMKNKYKNTPLIVLIYEHTVEEIGVDNFINYCKENNTLDVILVGETTGEIKEKLIKNGLKISCYVTFALPDDEVDKALNSNGFVYLQAKADKEVREGCETLDKCIKYLREKGMKNPIYCGVGISTPDDMHMVSKAGGDAAFVGSALLKRQDNLDELRSFIEKLKDGAKL